jgi:hypothetical protein
MENNSLHIKKYYDPINECHVQEFTFPNWLEEWFRDVVQPKLDSLRKGNK